MKRLAVVLTLIAAVGVAAGSALGAPAPLRVTSISPLVAERGDLVTIRGGGFGAAKLQVTVAGEPVALVEAIGSRASFRVPALGAVGPVSVVARNPGGQVGRIGLTVEFDGNTVALVDEDEAVGEPIDSGGGTIEVAGMTLEIPAGAVPEGETITLTPLTGLEGSPFAGAPKGVKMEPSGLTLLKPATLTLPRPSGAGHLVAFGFNGDGEGLHLVPYTSFAGLVSVQVWHFSGVGSVIVSEEELEAVLGYLPTPKHELAEQQIAAALALAATPADAEPTIVTALEDWYRSSVKPGLQIARTGQLGFFELAFGEWQAWLGHVALFSTSSWTRQIDEAYGLALSAAGKQASTLLPRCTAGGTPLPALRNVIRLATAVNLVELPLEHQLDNDGHALPTGVNLVSACMHVQVIAFLHPNALARGRDNRFSANATFAFFDGTSDNTIPLRFRLDDVSNGPPVPLATTTSSIGHFQTDVRPTDLGLGSYDLTVELATATTDDVLKALTAGRHIALPIRERLELDARRSGDLNFTDTIGSVTSGAGVTLRIRLAGDNVDNQTITLTHDGTGSLPATATTGSGGEAIVGYTSPAGAAIELVNATVTDGGFATGDSIVITTTQPIVVTVTPFVGFVFPGETLQFSASVTGTPNHAVIWSAAGGTISTTGLYTAGTTPGNFSVTAHTAATTPTIVGGATVTILPPENVTGLYIGEGPAGPGYQLSYQCNFTSVVGGGIVCGWFAGLDLFGVPNFAAARCQIETSGTSAGGAFTARITFCQLGRTALQAAVRIEGSIVNGRLVFTVFAPDPFDLGGPVHQVEHWDLTKFVFP